MKKLSILLTILTMALGVCNNIQPMALSANKFARPFLKAGSRPLNLVLKRHKGTRGYNNNSFLQKLKKQRKFPKNTVTKANNQGQKRKTFVNNTTVTNKSSTQSSATRTPKSSMLSSFKQEISNRGKDTFEGLKPIGKGILSIYKPALGQEVKNYYNSKIAKIVNSKTLSEEFKYLQKEKLTGRAIAVGGVLSGLEITGKIFWTFIGAYYLNTKQQLSYKTKQRLKKNFKESDTKIENYGNPFC